MTPARANVRFSTPLRTIDAASSALVLRLREANEWPLTEPVVERLFDSRQRKSSASCVQYVPLQSLTRGAANGFPGEASLSVFSQQPSSRR